MVNLMFIRFVCGEIDEDSHVAARSVGYVIYEDEAQVLAQPSAV